MIGGYDALKMGLHSLRQHLSVIPQVPFIFQGSVKRNIDPFDTVDNKRIWEVLQESGLADYVRKLEGELEA